MLFICKLITNNDTIQLCNSKRKVDGMKKLLMCVSMVMMLTVHADVEEPFSNKLLLYIPNRFLDLLDISSVTLGFGPRAKAELMATRAMNFGAGIGASADLVKAYNRQYGCALENGWDASAFWITAEDSEITKSTRMVQKYWYYKYGIPSPQEDIYNFYTGARDYWECGFTLSALVNIHLGFHPVEFADFMTGLCFIDLKGDDLTMDNFE